MMKIFKRTAAVILSAVIGASAAVIPVSADDSDTLFDNILTYEKIDGGLKITKCESSIVSVQVKDNIDGYDVIAVADNAFSDLPSLREVELPDSITEMGERVFAGSAKLEKVKLPAKMDTVPDMAFAGCESLKEVIFPEKAEVIGKYAFSYCTDLSWLEIPGTVTNINDNAFAFSGMGEELTLPEGVQRIGNLAFYNCRSIKKVMLPSTLSEMDPIAFMGCTALESYNVDPANGYYISDSGVLYSEQKSFLESYPAGKTDESFTVPQQVKYISDGAFFAAVLKR